MALTNLSYKARPQSNSQYTRRPKSYSTVSTVSGRRNLPKFALNSLMPNSINSTQYARADPPGTAGLPGHFTEMKTPPPNRSNATPSIASTLNSRKMAKLKDRFNEQTDATSIRSLAKSNTRSLTSSHLNMNASRSKSQASIRSVSYVTNNSRPSTSTKFNGTRAYNTQAQPDQSASQNDRTSTVSHVSRLNRANAHRKRILEVINRLNDTDLEKVDEMLCADEALEAD